MSEDTSTSSDRHITPLNESNYQQWKFSMQALLMTKGTCWLVVKGSYLQPGESATAAEKNKWEVANLQAAGLIYNNVASSIQPFIQDTMDNAKTMWETLGSKFQQQNSTARFIIVNNLLSAQKQADESLSTLIGRVDTSLQAFRGSHPADFTLAKLENEFVDCRIV